MEKWSSRLTFILAAVGSAVGIGNIWRFSSVVGDNGGGAYLLCYFLAILLFALPLMILELAVGRRLKKDVVSAFGSIKRQFWVFGWIICVILFLIMSYYLVITGWCLAYALFSAFGSETSFADFTSSYLPVMFFVISVLLTGLVVFMGVKHGIERLTRALIPLSFGMLAAMVLYTLSLEGFGEAVEFLFTPDFTVLSDASIWSAAFGQAFFSLSVGFGILITYGGYLDDSTDIPRSALIITGADLCVAILAGLVIFPIVFTYGLEPTLGTKLAFVTLPEAFQIMPHGNILAVAFFAILFFAALTSAVSMLEVNVTTLMTEFGTDRRKTASILTLGTVAIGLIPCLSYTSLDLTISGTRVLDLMDDTVGMLGLPVAAVMISVVFAWYLRSKDLALEVRGSWLPYVRLTTKYIVPIVLVAVTITTLIQMA
jgi:NSS family neurotransmitter:Na+ symporter